MPHFGELLIGRMESVATVALGNSPAIYLASRDGTLSISGGTVSLIEYGRNGVFTGLSVVGGLVPVRKGDTVRITYLVAPAVKLI